MVTVVIPDSIVGSKSCHSLEQATNTLYELARACVLFNVREIVIYEVPEPNSAAIDATEEIKPRKLKLDDETVQPPKSTESNTRSWEAYTAANILQYFITPTHLRKQVFGSKDKRVYHYAKKLPRIPGIAQQKPSNLIEGISLKKYTIRKKTKKSKKEKASEKVTPFVNLGFDKVFKLKEEVPVHSRVFVDLETKTAVAKPPADVERAYVVRAVSHFSHIFTQPIDETEYSHTVYVPSQTHFGANPEPLISDTGLEQLREAANPLIVFGRWSQIQRAVDADEDLDVEASSLFDGMFSAYSQARTEDAVMISLAVLNHS